jgi:hypothetical protein
VYHLNQCNLCSSNSLSTLYSQELPWQAPWSDFIERSQFPLKQQCKLCLRCGWIFKTPVYEPNELARLYNLDEPVLSLEAETMADRNAHYRGSRIYQTLLPYRHQPGRILDVGGRNGELMTTFLKAGYEVCVLDMDAGKPIDSKIVKIRSPFLECTDGRYDVIAMSHVLEHTETPGAFLKHAHSLLATDGLIFIEVPSELLTCLIKRHVGDHRHLSYFTRATLRAYIERSGFKCLSCNLLVDVVGSEIPLLRAVGRKREGTVVSRGAPDSTGLVRSLLDIFHPLPLLTRFLQLVGRSRSPTQ